MAELKPQETREEREDDYDEEEDDDYDPESKIEEEVNDEEEDDDDKEEVGPDYSNIQAATSQVKTRSQRYRDDPAESKFIGNFATNEDGFVEVKTSIDVDAIFNDLKSQSETKEEWTSLVTQVDEAQPEIKPVDSLEPEKIKIESSYAFAGRLITETKLVDANSEEAKAYMNSTASITAKENAGVKRSFVTVVRKVDGEDRELQIKLKRPSLIDKVLAAYGSKKQKLSTLEKSRLDWASFVDKRKIGDELKIHNKAGYLDKQDFLGRIQNKRDEHYQSAKEADRQRQWQLQNAK